MRGRPLEKPLKSIAGYPYRPATLFPTDQDIRKTWYITFYAYDILDGVMVRKRVLKEDINAIRNLEERIRFCNKTIEEINYFLKRDYHIVKEHTKKHEQLGFDFKGLTLLEAFDYAIKIKTEIDKVAPGTISEYLKTKSSVADFMKYKGLDKSYKLIHCNNAFINHYFDYLSTVRKNSNKTYNSRRGLFHAVIEVLLKRDKNLFKGYNPLKEVAFLKTETRRHAAYTNDQVKAIVQACINGGEPHLVLYIQFMIFSLARPNELRHLKVGHIHLAQRRILFLAENAKTNIEEYVGISEPFAKVIEESGILKHPPNHYVFSNRTAYYVTDPDRREISKTQFTPLDRSARKNQKAEMVIHHQPGEGTVSKNYFYKRIIRYIKQLGYHNINPHYDLYSFCHTGAISLYMATRDIKLLQRQKRHSTIDQTNTYLRDLGLFEDFEKLNNWHGPFSND